MSRFQGPMRPLRTALILLLGAWSLSFVALLAVYSISTARRLEANTLHALERRAKILGESIKDHQAKLRKIAESTEFQAPEDRDLDAIRFQVLRDRSRIASARKKLESAGIRVPDPLLVGHYYGGLPEATLSGRRPAFNRRKIIRGLVRSSGSCFSNVTELDSNGDVVIIEPY